MQTLRVCKAEPKVINSEAIFMASVLSGVYFGLHKTYLVKHTLIFIYTCYTIITVIILNNYKYNYFTQT